MATGPFTKSPRGAFSSLVAYVTAKGAKCGWHHGMPGTAKPYPPFKFKLGTVPVLGYGAKATSVIYLAIRHHTELPLHTHTSIHIEASEAML